MQLLAVLFGDEPVVTTDVAIYQRLLKGDEPGARSVLEEYIKQHAAADVHEEVLLPVLARARRDAVRGALTADESASIAAAVQRIVEELETAALAAARGRDEGEPAAASNSLRVPAPRRGRRRGPPAARRPRARRRRAGRCRRPGHARGRGARACRRHGAGCRRRRVARRAGAGPRALHAQTPARAIRGASVGRGV